MKLLLSSVGSSPEHDAALVEPVGKPLSDIRVAYTESAYDVYHDETLVEGGETLQRNGYSFELRFDAFLLTGGNPYYLRSQMQVTGAERNHQRPGGERGRLTTGSSGVE